MNTTATNKRNPRPVLRATDRIAGPRVQPLKPAGSGRRTLILLTLLLAGVALLLLQNRQGMAEFINRPIARVVIETQWQQVTEPEVSAVLAPYLGAGFFHFDVNQVQQALQQHPWVKRASVKKLWPDGLALSLTERVAIARWGEGALLSQEGAIFTPPQSAHLQALPRLSGPGETQLQVMEQYRVINQKLFPLGLKLTGLSLSPRGSWELEINERMRVVAGTRNVLARLDRFVEFCAGQAPARVAQFEYVDLRYDHGVAIRSNEEALAGVAAR